MVHARSCVPGTAPLKEDSAPQKCYTYFKINLSEFLAHNFIKIENKWNFCNFSLIPVNFDII